MATKPNSEEWREFFEVYHSLPELWKVKSDAFKDRNKKKIAFSRLLKVYRQIDKIANEDSLKKRLHNIKTCYRRELKNVDWSQRSGAGVDDEYVPILWYFDLLEFLRDQETQITGISTMDDDEEDVNKEVANEAVENANASQKRKKMVAHMAEGNELLKDALGHLQRAEELKFEASIYAESWATSFRKLPNTQQIYAKKAIEDILVLGQLGSLSLLPVNINSLFSYSSASSNPTHSILNISSSCPSRISTPGPAINQRPHGNEYTSIPTNEATVVNGYTSIQQLFEDGRFA